MQKFIESNCLKHIQIVDPFMCYFLQSLGAKCYVKFMQSIDQAFFVAKIKKKKKAYPSSLCMIKPWSLVVPCTG